MYVRALPVVDYSIYRREALEVFEDFYIPIALICVFWIRGALGGSFAI
jgi:hypothetical protein